MNKQKLPKGWKEVEMNEVCDLITDGTHKTPKYVKEGIPFISTINLQPFKNIFKFDSYKKYITEKEHKELIKRAKPKKGDILISKCGTIGVTQVVREDYEFSIFVGLMLVKPKLYLVSPEFLEVYLNSPIIKNKLERISSGSSRATLTIKGLKEFKIVLPPLDIQNKIISIMQKIGNAKELRKKADELTNDFLKSVFFEMFGNPINNDKNWIKCNLSKYGLLARGKSAHRPQNAKFLYGGKYPFIQTGDVRQSDSIYLKKYTQTYSEEGIKQSKLFYRGTLAITIAANIGETAVLAFDSYFPDSVVGFKVESPLFMSYLLKCYKPLLDSLATNTAQKNINLAILNNLEVIDIPIALQNKFASIVQEVEKLKQHQKRSNQEINNLFNALMQKAFKGELKC